MENNVQWGQISKATHQERFFPLSVEVGMVTLKIEVLYNKRVYTLHITR